MPRDHWYEDDCFWTSMAPVMFTEAREVMAIEEVEGISRLIPLKPGAAVLDMSCGAGRHSLELAKRGFSVVGVDRTRQFVADAATRATERQLPVEFVLGDMRSFSRESSFDAALVLWNTFGCLPDSTAERTVLRNLYKSLMPGGSLLIQTHGKEHISRKARRGGRDWIEFPGGVELEERYISDDWSRMDTRIILITGSIRQDFTMSCRLYSGIEMRSLLQAVGFSSVRLYADFDGLPYNSYIGEPSVYGGSLVAIGTK
jgi:cyclopropane fatty-acyl-phospholipid synthase-like methyltransferase